MHRKPWRTTVAHVLLAAAPMGASADAHAADAPPLAAPAAPVAPAAPAWERVTEGYTPWLSPSGTRLAFERYGVDLETRDERGQPVGASLLWIRDLATGEERRAPTDGTVTGWAGDDVVVFADGTAVRVAGAGPTPTFPRAATEAHTPAWTRSRDATRVAYVVRGLRMEDAEPGRAASGREHTIHVVVGGAPARALALEEHVDVRNARGLLAFSPDGRKLAFHLGFMHYGQLPHPRIGVVDVDTGTCTFVADETAGAWGAYEQGDAAPTAAQAWDAGGRRFVFVKAFGPAKRDLLTAAADGTDVRRLTVDGRPKSSACLSPDGERCAYVAHVAPPPAPRGGGDGDGDGGFVLRGGGVTELRVVALRTGASTVVTTSAPRASFDALQWSPDGAWLWFRTIVAGRSVVARVAAPPTPAVPAGTPPVDAQVDPLDEDLEAIASDDRHVVEAAVARRLEDDDPRVTAAFVAALRRWSRGDASGPFWALLVAIQRRRAVAAVPVLVDALSRGELVAMASRVLLAWEVADAVPAWRAATRSPVPAARGFATVALARHGDAAAWARLEGLLQAARVGAEGGGRAHRDDMPDEVRAGNDTRAAVAEALRYVRDPRSVELLLPLLDDVGFLYTADRDVLVRDRAVASLVVLSGEAGTPRGADRAAWTTWWEGVGKTLPVATGGAR